ncbi:S41 family peptidase [Fimbriimonas ginsengisoli]|uniref:Tail specific protease domain-containing protein n=1 Tax=Fimbriimonas ginsengisoli Gsoil 348 TaxID=661478 RepID=A0A068NUW4_FIMGI|nr:S41 family peptidase [Fimbriimonas ginsengisoli]AIE87333.1 hypothetical protein OP10G_3965 [Fimbriimonas ginsengisoli Gsoil 348]
MVTVVFALASCLAPAEDHRQDLNFLIDSWRDYGAYVRDDGIDVEALRKAYAPKFASVSGRPALLRALEQVVAELHDFHASLGTNDDASPRLVPSGTDVVGHWEGDKAIVDQVKTESLAARAGVKAGEEITSINRNSVREECRKWLGIRRPDRRAWDWALNSALAGRWNANRILGLRCRGQSRTLTLPTAAKDETMPVLTVEHREGGILYIRIENSLGNDDLIRAFDATTPQMRAAKRIVLDLRNTPSGGNSDVARGIMGLYISHRMPFQRHRVEERSTGTVRDWVEYATPRLKTPVTAKMVVLVGRWTSSMGEGIAIGFDAMHRATVVGTQMAGLRGAVDRFILPQSGIPVAFPTEQVFHINGLPRHEWIPPVRVIPRGNDDVWWFEAKRLLTKNRRGLSPE